MGEHLVDDRGDNAWFDPEKPPIFIGRALIKVDDLLWAVWLDDIDNTHPHLWHWCDRNVQNEKPGAVFDRDPGWALAGTGAHQLVTLDPLHLEPSVYWPDCCGMHGFIRGGRWASC